MNYENLKLMYVAVCVMVGLAVLSPTLAAFVTFPVEEPFSELWILGSNGMAEGYPFNVSAGDTSSVLLGVSNQMGGLKYYLVYVKLSNQTGSLPNSTAGVPSVLEPVFEYRLLLRHDETWSGLVHFSLADVFFDENFSRISRILVDECAVNVDVVTVWDDVSSGFYYQLFFELWIYDEGASDFQFHNRSVGLWLNLSRQL